MKVACLTVFYPEMNQFIDDYFDCIQNQTYNEFDLIIINDKLTSPIDSYIENINVNVEVFNYSESPQKNRLYGLKKIHELGYDIAICSDSDEIMERDRIEKVVEYFSTYEESNIVYNNGVYNNGNDYFDNYYKDQLSLNDIIDFNVLGYGALNVKSDFIPFILGIENKNVKVFDWWLALVYLLHFKSVDFLRNVTNNYTMHDGNFIGPVFGIKSERILLGIEVKKSIYDEMEKYCGKNNFIIKRALFKKKYQEILNIEEYISQKSLSGYIEFVKNNLNQQKYFWWQDVIPLTKNLEKEISSEKSENI